MQVRVSINISIVLISFLFSLNSFAKSRKDFLIGGSYYKKIIQVKDVIADVLPPPAYIVESYLVSFLLLNETEIAMTDKKIDPIEMKKIDALVENLRQLKEGLSENDELVGYFERINIWTKYLGESSESEKQLKELMTKNSVAPAKEFYLTFETKFIPALKNGNLEDAKKYQIELKDAFNRHRAVIVNIVMLAKKTITELEEEALKKGADAKIKGQIYNRIILMKDLIADILPPPSFIIESYLLSWKIVYEVEKSGLKSSEFEKISQEFKLLKLSFLNRRDYWLKNLKNKDLKNLLTNSSYHMAMKFYKVYDTEFLPALRNNDIQGAKKIINEKMKPAYDGHRKVIDQLVLAADNRAIKIESEMAGKLQKL